MRRSKSCTYQSLPSPWTEFLNPPSVWYLLTDTGSVKSDRRHRWYLGANVLHTWIQQSYSEKIKTNTIDKHNNHYLRSGSGVSKAVKSSISVIALTVASSPSTARSVWSSSHTDRQTNRHIINTDLKDKEKKNTTWLQVWNHTYQVIINFCTVYSRVRGYYFNLLHTATISTVFILQSWLEPCDKRNFPRSKSSIWFWFCRSLHCWLCVALWCYFLLITNINSSNRLPDQNHHDSPSVTGQKLHSAVFVWTVLKKLQIIFFIINIVCQPGRITLRSGKVPQIVRKDV